MYQVYYVQLLSYLIYEYMNDIFHKFSVLRLKETYLRSYDIIIAIALNCPAYDRSLEGIVFRHHGNTLF